MRLPPLRRSLSARLMLATLLFVTFATLVIFIPAVIRFHYIQVEERLSAAHTAALAVDVAPGRPLTSAQQERILRHIGSHRVEVRRPTGQRLVLSEADPPPAEAAYTQPEDADFKLLTDTFVTLFTFAPGAVRLNGRSPQNPDDFVETLVERSVLGDRIRTFALHMTYFAFAIAIAVTAMVFVVLRMSILLPLRHLTASMIAFRNHPEDPGRVISVSGRRDEIGLAEWELAAMQAALRRTLGQRGRLAALGEAVSKINHDLRSILSTARLVSDRLAESTDPIVKKSLPPLLSSLDRAVRLCKRTLDFAAAQPVLRRSQFELRRFVEDAVATAALVETGGFTFINEIPPEVNVYVDRDQFFRAIVNLVRNAVQAKARRLSMAAHRAEDGGLVVTVVDDGVGIPKPAQATLFRPFAASSTSGGTGLGLAIAREVVRSHGGSIELAATGPMGTTFEVTLPESAVGTSPETRAQRRWGAFRSVEGRKKG